MKFISKPAFLAGKLAYLQGIPADAIDHVAGETRNLWLAGRAEMRAELMSLRPPVAKHAGGVFPKPRPSVLRSMPGLPRDQKAS